MNDNDLIERLQRDSDSVYGVPIKVTGYCYLRPFIRLVHHATYIMERDVAQEMSKEHLGQVMLAREAASDPAEGSMAVLPIITNISLN